MKPAETTVNFLSAEQRGYDSVRILRHGNSKQVELGTPTILRAMMEVGWDSVRMGANGHPMVTGGDPTELSAGQLLEKGFHELKVVLTSNGGLVFTLPKWRTTKTKHFFPESETEKSFTISFGILRLKLVDESKAIEVSFKPSALLLGLLSGEIVQRQDYSQRLEGYSIMLMICLKSVMNPTCHPVIITLISFALIYSSFFCFRELCAEMKVNQ